MDLLNGDGLYRALKGVDVAIDVSDPVPDGGRPGVGEALATASRNVAGACAAREVERLVLSTMAGIDDPVFDGLPYFEGKRAAREILLDGPVPTTIVKSTQWFESALDHDAVSFTDHGVIVEDWLIQPIAADTVADVLVEAALGQTHTPRRITGPQTIRLPELVSKLLARRGDSRRVRAVQPAIAALATGVLAAPEQAIVVGPDVETWLRSAAPAGTNGHPVDGSRETPVRLGRPDLSRL